MTRHFVALGIVRGARTPPRQARKRLFKNSESYFGRASSATRYFSFFTPYKLALAYYGGSHGASQAS